MKKNSIYCLILLSIFSGGCSESSSVEEVTESWQANIYKVKNCDYYQKGEMFNWSVTYKKNNTFKTVYSNGPDGISKTSDDTVLRIDDTEELKFAKYLSDSVYAFEYKPEDMVKSLGLVQIKESERNAGHSTNLSNVNVNKHGTTSFALRENGVLFYAHSDGGGSFEISGLDSKGERSACVLFLNQSNLLSKVPSE